MTADRTGRVADLLEPPCPPRCRPSTAAATLPAGFVAGGLSAGIKASGRPDLAVIVAGICAHRRPGRRGQRTGPPAAAAALFTRNRMAAAPVRLSQQHLLATDPAGAAGAAGRAPSSAPAAAPTPRPGRPATPTRPPSRRPWRRPLGIEPERTLTLSTGVIGARLPVARVTDGLARLVPALGDGPEALLAAAQGAPHHRLADQGRPRRPWSCRPRTATAGDGPRVGHRQGRGHDPSGHGHDAGRPADRRDRRSGRRWRGCCGRPRRARGTSSPSTATRAPTTPSSCSPRAPPGPRRSQPGIAGGGAAWATR